MKDQIELILERTNIRCAMWAAGLITEEKLDQYITNDIRAISILETGEPEYLYNFLTNEIHHVSFEAIKIILKDFKESNESLIRKYFP
jgi:hypothetical protein